MKKIAAVMAFLALMAFGCGNALADLTLPAYLDSITTGPVPGDSHATLVGNDQHWSVDASGGAMATMVVEFAGFAGSNTFGLFDIANPTNKVQLFSGGNSAGAKTAVAIDSTGAISVFNFASLTLTTADFAGNSFGFYLTSPDGTFYSDSSLNADSGADHMAAYQGANDVINVPGVASGLWTSNEFILGWEDLFGGGDGDFNDMVVMVESVSPTQVPEPGALLLLGSGLVGIGLYRRRKA